MEAQVAQRSELRLGSYGMRTPSGGDWWWNKLCDHWDNIGNGSCRYLFSTGRITVFWKPVRWEGVARRKT
jgi:hypothetical protein